MINFYYIINLFITYLFYLKMDYELRFSKFMSNIKNFINECTIYMFSIIILYGCK